MVIRRLGEVGEADRGELGGKAAALGELISCGAPVPPGFVIGVSDYSAHAHRCGLGEALPLLIADRDWGAVERVARERLASFPLEGALSFSILEEYRILKAPSVAVRSSAIGEDGTAASFAGQYRTLLDVRGEEDLLPAVLSCWSSFWTVRALEYRHRRSLDHLSGGMGVVVQAMVPAEVSGVLFTVDPVDERSDRMLVQVVGGLGEALVSGKEMGVVYRVDRESLRAVDSDGVGPGLDPDEVEVVSRMAKKVEDHFGCPQDMEFGFLGKRLAVFQTRPITTLSPALAEKLDPVRKPTWTERMLLPLAAEHYTTAPKPLDNLVFTRLVGGAAEALIRSGGKVSAGDEKTFREEIWRQGYRLPRHRLTWRILLSGWQQLKVLREDRLAWWMAGPKRALREVSEHVDLVALSDQDLFLRAHDILETWAGFLGERMYVAGAYRTEFLLRFLVGLAVGRDTRDQVMAQLLRGLETPVTEANLALWRLSRTARENPAVRSAVGDLSPEGLENTPQGQAFLLAVDRFLTAYGHREGASWYLSAPTWGQDPLLVWRLLSSFIELDEPPTDSHQANSSFLAARGLVEGRFREVPWIRDRFFLLLDAMRTLTRFREQSHFDLTRPLRALQEVAGEWGRRLADRRILSDPDDVFYLTHQEVRNWLLGSAPPSAEVEKIVAVRKATYQRVNTKWQEERCPRAGDGSRLNGVATSPGLAQGPVRIIRGEDQFHRFRPGEVLVCSYTNPSWTPLFAGAAAVVTETGGPASHAAIVAREYGIPCVMAVAGVMGALKDGEEIAVDGDHGEIHRVASAVPRRAQQQDRASDPYISSAKKSFPLSSTRMKAGKSSTSIL